MKFKYSNTLLAAAVLFIASSCSEELEVEKVPDFDVTTESSTYKVNEPINFNITGNADFISFYSGAASNDYEFRKGRIVNVAGKGASLSFSSSVQLGTQANQVAVMASTDFNGDYTNFASVKAATWTDITSRFVLGTSATFAPSTPQDISDLLVSNKPLYIAFKYVTRPQATNGLARNWYIQSFAINSTELLGTTPLTIVNQAYASFVLVDENKENAPARSLITPTRISLLGNVYKFASDPIFNPNNPIFDPNNPIYNPLSPLYQPTAVRPTYVPFDPNSPYNDPTSEHWAISKGISIDTVNLGPDPSIPIRNITNSKLTSYRHTFTTPGTYTVTFVAANVTIDERKEVVKQITLTITP